MPRPAAGPASGGYRPSRNAGSSRYLYGPEDGTDSFRDRGFESEFVAGAAHDREWEHPVMRQRMLAFLR